MERRAETAARPLARRVLDALTVLAFLCAIAAPAADLALRPDEARSPQARELRSPAPRPPRPRTLSQTIAWPSQYEQHFKDSFGLRDVLLRWNSIVKVFGFGVSPSSEVYFGKQGWLFYAGQYSRENHRGARPFSTPALEAWARTLESKRRLLASMGIRYLYVVVPDKESVYPELLPDTMRPIGPTRLDQWLAHLAEHAPDVEVLDLRPALIAAKRFDAPDDWVYTNLGTHWNGRGSVVAARAILERLNAMLGGGFAPEHLDFYVRVPHNGSGDAWSTRMYIEDLLVQRIHGYRAPKALARIRTEGAFGPGRVYRSELPDSTSPRVFLMHDSFGPHLETLLAAECSGLECRWGTTVDTGEIAPASPAVFIDMYVERSLNSIDPSRLALTDKLPWPRRFAAASRKLWVADRTTLAWGFRPMGSTLLGPAVEAPEPGLTVTVGRPSDTLRFGPIAPEKNAIPVLHVVLDAPAVDALRVWHLPDGEQDAARREGYTHPLVPGRNDVYVPLERVSTPGVLFLRPGSTPGAYLLRELEIRSVGMP